MRAARGGRPGPADGYVLAAMLLAATTGRLLDARGLLPGVHESGLVRGGAAGWLTALIGAGAVAAVAARRWTATRSLAATAAVATTGQAVLFLVAEAAVRLASGSGPVDADGIVGALLQAALAAVLLLALTAGAGVALRARRVQLRSQPRSPRLRTAHTADSVSRLTSVLAARAPPPAARC